MSGETTRFDQPALAGVSTNGAESVNGNGRVNVCDMVDGQVSGAFAVRDREVRQKRNGESFLQISLADRTGGVRAIS